VKDAEEALRLANDSHLGLNATVFGPEAAREQMRGASNRGTSS
jgi:acyl-CoA reductase-like NAD-dependent aldehyde dehydrogenase